MKYFPLVSAILICGSSQAVENNVHEKCLKASDYKGCVEAHTTKPNQKSAIDDFVIKDSVAQINLRGSYGRYISFVGRASFPTVTTGFGSSTSNWNSNGNAAGSSASTDGFATGSASARGYGSGFSSSSTVQEGWYTGNFTYNLDCIEGTADRINDASFGSQKPGWFNVNEDPTALMAYKEYCPLIDSLPKRSAAKN